MGPVSDQKKVERSAIKGEVKKKHLPEIKEIAEQGFDLMKEKLRPEQIVKLDELRARFKREREIKKPSRP